MLFVQLSAETYSVIISQILYAQCTSCLGGFLSTELGCKINALVKRLKRFSYINYNIRLLLQNY